MSGIGEFSRFNKTPEIIIDGKETVGVWVQQSWLINKPDASKIGVFPVNGKYEGRPDLIAEKIYNSSQLAWVIISFNAMYYNNNARDVFNWPRAGTNVMYPINSIVMPEVS